MWHVSGVSAVWESLQFMEPFVVGKCRPWLTLALVFPPPSKLQATGHRCLGVITLRSRSNRNTLYPHRVSLYKKVGERGVLYKGKEL